MSKRIRYGYEAPIIVIAAMHRPRTIAGIMRVTGFGQDHVTNIVAAIRDLEMAHVHGWEKKPGTWAMRKYVFGFGDDAPCPAIPRQEAKCNTAEICTRIIVKLIQFLQEEPATQAQIADCIELSPKTCSKIMRLMLENNIAHVSGYVKKSHDGFAAMQYSLGKGENLPRPKGMTKQEKSRKSNFVRSAKAMDVFSVALRQIEAANEERRAA